MGLFSSIVGAVAPSLIGGLFGGSSKSSSQTSRVNFKQMRDDATAAGYNPLTALLATGGAGNVTTTEPKLSSAQFIGEAIGEGFKAYGDYQDKERDREYEDLRAEMMRQEIEALKHQNANPFAQSGFGYVREKEEMPGEQGLEPPALEIGRRTGTDMRDLDADYLQQDPRVSDAENAEARYSEAGGFFKGAMNLDRDLKYSEEIAKIRKTHGREAAERVNAELVKDPTITIETARRRAGLFDPKIHGSVGDFNARDPGQAIYGPQTSD